MNNTTWGKMLAELVLVGILFACALFTAWISVRYFFSVREAQGLQAQAIFINNTRNAVQGLANDAVEYSKRNSAIDPILQQFDIKLRPTNAPASAPPAPSK
jgi:hypothetical protein